MIVFMIVCILFANFPRAMSSIDQHCKRINGSIGGESIILRLFDNTFAHNWNPKTCILLCKKKNTFQFVQTLELVCLIHLNDSIKKSKWFATGPAFYQTLPGYNMCCVWLYLFYWINRETLRRFRASLDISFNRLGNVSWCTFIAHKHNIITECQLIR